MADKQQPGKESNKDKPGKNEYGADASGQPLSEEEKLTELRDTAEAMAKLAEDENAFTRTVEAFRAQDAEKFQGELSKIGLLNRCRLICRFLCTKHCVFKCSRLCKQPQSKDEQLAISEIREFVKVVAQIVKDDALLKQFVDAADRDDAEAFDALITRLKLEAFCHQLCHWLCFVRCRLVCKKMCPPPPLITEVANIPTSQITASGAGTGLGAGGSLPPGTTPPDNKIPPTGGTGDHPFGGLANIRGVFSIASPFQYKVEFASASAGPWTLIDPPILDIYFDPLFPSPGHTFPTFNNYRSPGVGGWYNVADMGLLGLQYLTDWQTPSADRDNIYYLKLTVRNAALVEFESPLVPARVDNGQPSTPVIGLALQTPDGQRQPLGCCEKIEQGEGNLLVITLTASDENFSHIGVSLMGGCGASYDIKDANTGEELSKYYNGNIADTGYAVPTTFLWDPWAAGVNPCCYIIYVTINDRAIVDNYLAGHTNANWHSITIA
jgi:hypothetical protein